MARTTGKSGFKMRSGNKPTFAKMGSSPANMRTFGIGQGTSPYKETDYAEMQKKSAKLDPRYGEMSLEEYTAEVKRQQKMYEETGDYDAKNAFTNKNTEKTNVENKNEELNPDDIETKEDIDNEQKSGSRVGQILSGLGKVGAAALTGGLDAVYGTGKIQYTGGGTRFLDTKVDDDKDKKDKEFGKTALDE